MTSRLAVAASVAIAIHRELEDDYVGLWEVPWHVRRAIPQPGANDVRDISAAVLEALVGRDAALGTLDETTGRFYPWDSDAAVAAAMSAWRELGRDPSIGEVGWLALTS